METPTHSSQRPFCRQKDDIGPESAYNRFVIHGMINSRKLFCSMPLQGAKRRNNAFSINYMNSGPIPTCHENTLELPDSGKPHDPGSLWGA
ncbi:MAG: hypothetical protein R6W72_10525 [Desulfurivibrionaceae bacterium]